MILGTARADWAAYEHDIAVVLTAKLGVACKRARPPREYWRNGNRRRSPRQRGAASRGEDGTNCAPKVYFPAVRYRFPAQPLI
jgi:hypothetical protein